MSRSSSIEVSQAARELGRRLAAAGGLLVALVALLAHAPLWLCCGRACLTLVALLLVTRLGAAALGKACEYDHALENSKKEAGP